MDPRVYAMMQILRKKAFLPLPSNSHSTTCETSDQEEQKMSLEKMALKFNLSESRMRNLFKSQVGLPPTQFVKKLKMDEAARRLRNTYNRVTRIAADLGFESNSYFARSFKKAYGMTPTQYRKLHQRQSEGERGEVNRDSFSP